MNQNNYCIIMAGGQGSRFWPMSRANHPKQFIDILGQGQSMLQSTFERYARLCPRENIFIVTAEAWEEQVRQQIPGLKNHQVLCEPQRRNTAPCVAYAAAIINEINPNANVIVSPSDHAIFNEEKFEQDMNEALAVTERNDWVVTLGAVPVNPNTKYGYIQFSEESSTLENDNLHKVITFTEKPPLEMAMRFIQSGEFLWNAGIFVWRLPVLMAAYRQFLPSMAETMFNLSISSSKEDVENAYSSVEKISVDFGIIEKADNVHVMKSTFGWSDVETWDSLYNTCEKDEAGNAIASGDVQLYDCSNCMIHIPKGRTLIVKDLDGYIVNATEKKILICPRDQEQMIAKFASDYSLKQSK